MALTGDDTPSEQTSEELLERVLAFAEESVGPASKLVVSKPGALALILSRHRRGAHLEDAVLAELHKASCNDRLVADEFLSFFLIELNKVGKRVISRGLRRYLDSGDLVNSVLGDLWTDFQSVSFRSREQFLRFLANRLYWKGADHARRKNQAKRREDRRTEVALEELQIPSDTRTPSSLIASAEEVENLALVLMRLGEEDREFLYDHLCGQSVSAMAKKRGLAYHTTYARLNRVIAAARKLYNR